MQFDKPYNRKDFSQFMQSFLPDDFAPDENVIADLTSNPHLFIQSAVKLGKCETLDLEVFEVMHQSTHDARVGLSREAFRLMQKYSYSNRALIAFVPVGNSEQWRFSLLQIELEQKDHSARLTKNYSNPRRYSFLLGEYEKVKTPKQFLIDEGKVRARKRNTKDYTALDDLCYRFSIEPLSDEFFNRHKICYNNFVEFFTGKRKIKGKDKWEKEEKDCRENPSKELRQILGDNYKFNKSYLQAYFNGKEKDARDFCKRLLGRIVFLYFLQNKGWLGATTDKYTDGDRNFVPNFLKETDYSYDELTKLFYNTLNTYRPNDDFKYNGNTVKIPFLNGGLFEKGDEKESSYVPKELLANFVNFLNDYNFTIDESSPVEQVVGIDPEMLGHIFEDSLEDNKDKGTFYTPKEIVHYMCRESLIEYLVTWFQNKGYKIAGNTELGSTQSELFPVNKNRKQLVLVDESTVKQIDRKVIEKLLNKQLNEEDTNLIKQHIKEFHSALDEVKICDPAIGSGAFPMGLLKEIFSTKQMLYFFEHDSLEGFNASEVKFNIIQNSIYGVDIEKGAVDIARLRFWLSLIIDEERPRPLPNLDYKIVVGDSLVSKYENEVIDIDWNFNFESKGFMGEDISQHEQKIKLLQQISEKQKTYFSPQSNKKLLNSEIRNLKIDLLINQLELMISINKDFETQPIKSNFKDGKKFLKATDIFFQVESWKRKIRKLQKLKNHLEEPLIFFNWCLDFPEVMNPYLVNDKNIRGFDIVIGNPPYVSTKGVSEEDKKNFVQTFGFSDDTYNHFFFKGFSLLKYNSILTYIVPKTFWTTQTKRNLRDLLLSKNIKYIFDTANPFESAMVDTCIVSVQNEKLIGNNKILFLDGRESITEPKQYYINQKIYLNTQNSVIFKPTSENLKIYELYGEKVKDLYNQWWDKIKTSADIAKNSAVLEEYRRKLKPGDIALLGCLTEGGQGLATANNGKYIAVRKSTKWAKNILESRPKKLAEAIAEEKIQIEEMLNFVNTNDFLASLSEKEIAELFDKLKEQYGRDIFGQGYIYRLVDDSEIADVDTLTEDEKKNGISETKSYYVPYDKGDKDGNRWYLETPFAIAWSQKNVGFLKANSGKKGEGMPVVRNPQFYFKEGFCWSDINTTFLKCRKKQKSINDVKSMSLFSITDIVPEYYIVCLINSHFMSYYVDDFVNNTQTFQINDARQLPIIIPTDAQLEQFKSLYNNALELKKNGIDSMSELPKIECEINKLVELLYYSV